MYRCWRKNDSWAIRVRYNWKFDIVLQNLRRIQYIRMNTDAIETIFAWRDYHFLIQIWTWPFIEVEGKMIRGQFGWGIIESLTLFFKACVVYNISSWKMMRWRHDLHDVTTISLFRFYTWPCIEVDGKMIRGRFVWGIIESLELFLKACVVYNISAWIPLR